MKKKVVTIILAVLAVAALLFCLIYTRPRTLESIIGEETPTTVIASTNASAVANGQISSDRWELTDQQESDPAICARIMELLESTKYRLSLVSLTRPNMVSGNGGGNTMLTLFFQDGYFVSLDCLGSVVAINLHDSRGFLVASAIDEEMLTELSGYIAQIGEKP